MPSILASLPPAPKIAVLKPGGLGDFLATTPALRSLKAARPDARITLIARHDLVAFCRRYAYLERVVACPPFPGVADGPAESPAARAALAALRAERFALAFQWAGDGRHSNRFIQALAPALSVGSRTPDAPPLDLWVPFTPYRHEIQRFLDQVALVGAPPVATVPDVPLQPRDLRELQALDGGRLLAALDRGGTLGLNPCAADPLRRWPPERFAAVARALWATGRFQHLILVGGPGQAPQTAAVRALLGPLPVIDLTGCLSLGGLAALLARLDLFITNDGGPAHLATALAVPTVIVFGAGPPVRWCPPSWLWQRPVADWHAPCRRFPPGCCADRSVARCLEAITPAMVIAEAQHLLLLRDRLGQAWRALAGDAVS